MVPPLEISDLITSILGDKDRYECTGFLIACESAEKWRDSLCPLAFSTALRRKIENKSLSYPPTSIPSSTRNHHTNIFIPRLLSCNYFRVRLGIKVDRECVKCRGRYLSLSCSRLMQKKNSRSWRIRIIEIRAMPSNLPWSEEITNFLNFRKKSHVRLKNEFNIIELL